MYRNVTQGNFSSTPKLPMLEGLIDIVDYLALQCTPSGNSSEDSTKSDINFHFYFYKVLTPTVLGIIMVLGLFGNGLVMTVIVTKKKMRTRVNVLLLNLAASDVLFLLFCVPMTAYHFASNNWEVGEIACKLYKYFTHVTLFASMYTLVAISVMRYILVARSTTVNRSQFRLALAVTCTVIWVSAVTVNIFVIDKYKIKYFKVCTLMPYYYCGLEESSAWGTIFISLFIFAYVVPVLLIALFYGLLIEYLRQSRAKSSLRTENNNGDDNRRRQDKLRQVSRLVLIVVLVFAVSWLPLHVHFLISYFGKTPASRAYEIFRVLSHVLAYGNSCVNPLIYNYVSRDFRSSFRALMSRSSNSFL